MYSSSSELKGLANDRSSARSVASALRDCDTILCRGVLTQCLGFAARATLETTAAPNWKRTASSRILAASVRSVTEASV